MACLYGPRSNHANMKKVLILGYGSLGRAFVRLYGSRYEVLGVKREASDAEIKKA